MQTGYIILTWIVLVSLKTLENITRLSLKQGFHLEIVGPTIPTLAANINSHYTEIGTATAAKSLGYLIANCLEIFLQRTVDNHSYAVLTCGFVLPAIGIE